MNSKRIGIMLVITIFLAIAGGMFLYLNSPKIKFMNLLSKEYKSFTSVLSKAKDSKISSLIQDSTITSTGSMSLNVSLDEPSYEESVGGIIDIINSLNINFQYGCDPLQDKTYLKFNSLIEDEDFITMEIYQMNDKKYMYFPGIYDKYIESSSAEMIESDSGQADDLLYLSEKIIKSFILALDPSDFVVSTGNVEVNEQAIKAEKISLTLTDKRYKEIANEVLLGIKKDQKSLEIMNKIDGITDANEEIDEAIASLDEKILLENNLVIDVYNDNNEIVKMDVFYDESLLLEYLNYKITGTVKEVTLFTNDEEIVSVKVEQKSSNNSSYKILMNNGLIVIDGTVSKAVDSSVDKTWTTNLSMGISLSYDNKSIGYLEINSNIETKIDEKIKMIEEITNSIKESDLTEEDHKTISDGFWSKIYDVLLMEMSEVN